MAVSPKGNGSSRSFVRDWRLLLLVAKDYD